MRKREAKKEKTKRERFITSSILPRASFAAGIAAVRRERRKRGKMAAGRDDILEVID
jgi:energy-converting hydrogenase Eha subunit A